MRRLAVILAATLPVACACAADIAAVPAGDGDPAAGPRAGAVRSRFAPATPHRSGDGDAPARMTAASGPRPVTGTGGTPTLRPPVDGDADVVETITAGAANEVRLVASDIAPTDAPPPRDRDRGIAGIAGTPAAADKATEVVQIEDGATSPRVPEAGGVPVRPAPTVPRPEPPAPPATNPVVIIPAEGDTLPPAPDPTRPATARPGATVPPPRLPEPATAPPTVILPTDGTVAPSPRPRVEPAEPARDEADTDAPGSGGDGAARPRQPLISVAGILGRAVRDETGTVVGEVSDVLLSRGDHKADIVVVTLGSGFGGRSGEGVRVHVRAERVAIDPLGGSVVVPRTSLDFASGGSGRTP